MMEPPDTPRGFTRRGVFFGVLAGLGQATGLVLSKQGMFGEFSPFQANVIRMLAGTVVIWSLTFLQGSAGATFRSLREKPRALRLLALGALVGPVLGVSSSLLAVQHTDRRGKHAHGAAAGHPAAHQLFCVQGKARLAGGGGDVPCDPWCCGLISGIMVKNLSSVETILQTVGGSADGAV
jgi:hypothetical protein